MVITLFEIVILILIHHNIIIPSDAKKSKSHATGAGAESEAAAYGTYASDGGQKLVYRVRKAGAYGSYTIVTEHTDTVKSREELLQLRSKKKSDRHCS
jgi:hypothetical protein